MHILFITEVSPFPTHGGERLRTLGLITAVAELGHEVTAVVANDDGADIKKYSIKGVEFIEYNFKKRYTNIFNKTSGYYTKDKQLNRLIETLLMEKKINIAFIDYFFLGQYISFFQKKGIKVIYGTHNAQSLLTKQNISGNLFRRLRMSALFITQYFHERIYLPKTDYLIVVSNEDKKYYTGFVNPGKISIIQNFININDYKPASKKRNYLAISGNFHSFQNKLGAGWFIRNVWDKDLWDKTELLLAGKGSDEFLDDLEKDISFKQIKATGTVDDIKPFIASAKASIVPLFHGSGSRLKCIEAMALNTQVISTRLGAEGIEHQETIMIAENESEFRKQIFKVLNNEDIKTNEARLVCLEKYSIKPVKKTIEKILSEFY